MQNKKCSKCGELKEIECFSIKRASKDGRMNICKFCDAIKSRKWHIENPDKSKTRGKNYRENNREYVLQRDRNRYNNDKLNILKQRKEYYDNNKAIIIARVLGYQKENREINRRAQRKHYKNNRSSYMAKSATRRAVKLNATPSWLNEIHRMQIQWFYDAAKMMSDTTGIAHHVDHIHPLQGENFSGLHVPWNLRCIEAKENISKSNKFPSEFSHLSWGSI